MTGRESHTRAGTAGSGPFWKIAGAGAAFQGGAAAVDSATIVASLVYHLTGSTFAVGAASAVVRLGWLLPQIAVGFLAQRARRRMPFYMAGAFGRAACLAVIAVMLVSITEQPPVWAAAAFLVLWTVYSFVSGIVAVPYNDIVGRVIPSSARSRMLAWRFFGGGLLAIAVAAVANRLIESQPIFLAHGFIFVIAAALMLVSSISFISVDEPPPPASESQDTGDIKDFLRGGWRVFREDTRFRLFLYTQWLGGATFMALPFYVIAASRLGITVADVAILLGAQTVGSLASNALWGKMGDSFGKLQVLLAVGGLRLLPPLGALAMMLVGPSGGWAFAAFILLFIAIGALLNGMTIGYLGYLMEISPDDRRPAYSAYFNAMASPAALLPIVGAAIAETFSLGVLFAVAAVAGVIQFALLKRLGPLECT